jgi:cell division protein FtsB
MWWFLIVLIALMIPLTAVILDSQLGRALAARLERGRPADADGVDRRLAALETEVERLAREIHRLEEESEFLQRLLEGRPASGELLPGNEHDG